MSDVLGLRSNLIEFIHARNGKVKFPTQSNKHLHSKKHREVRRSRTQIEKNRFWHVETKKVYNLHSQTASCVCIEQNQQTPKKNEDR